MKTQNSSSLVAFHTLAIELRRLKNQRQNSNAIATAALLINQSLFDKNIEYSSFLQHPDSQRLISICKIICYRFSHNPSDDILTIINLARFSQPLIGQLLFLTTLLLVHQSSFNEESLKSLYNYNPNFFKSFLLSRIYSNPGSLFQSHETLLPLQIPHLTSFVPMNSKGQNKGQNSTVLIKFLIQFTLSKSFEHIIECATNDSLFDAFANFVFDCPKFFVMATQIFSIEELINIFKKLKKINAYALLRSFLDDYQETNSEVTSLIFQIYEKNDFLKFSKENEIFLTFSFLKKNNRWDIIELFYNKYSQQISSILQDFYQNNQRKYLEIFAKFKFNYLIDAVTPIIMKGVIEPRNYIYLLHKKDIIFQLLKTNPNILHHIIQSNEIKDKFTNEINSDKNLKHSYDHNNINKIVKFIHDNPQILPDPLLNPDTIVIQLYNIDELLFLDLFQNNKINEATTSMINYYLSRPDGNFPTIEFFQKLAKTVKLDQILPSIYHEHRDILQNSNWRNIITSIPQFLYFTLSQIGTNNEEIHVHDFEYVALLNEYISKNIENFSTQENLEDFINLVLFFLSKPPEQLALHNLSLATQLSLLDCFAQSSHFLFNFRIKYSNYKSDDDLDSCDITHERSQNIKYIHKFIDFFMLFAQTNIFSLGSPSNHVLERDFIEPLVELCMNDKIIGMMENILFPISEVTVNESNDFMNYRPHLEIEFPKQLDNETIELLSEYLNNSIPNIEQIDNLDESTKVELTELAIRLFSVPNSPLWRNLRLIQSLARMIETLHEKVNLTPRFLQCLSYLLNSNEIDRSNDELINGYHILATNARLNHSFIDVLEQLLK
ncbi:hypothetical protein TRFO_42083 [Tritrichomonas foetus]|uniref:Uncharacterized protein n=1 Tax=Tritrichomonas foetus TaxID=1144522 RepID=A0A1J4L2E6_9EUKA|nr:hypothetical protein TRFO_42083 [Tritrichomonas foetus]|eukprot:OHT16069.1 hypothetical protein TRFO_42083 [Tritrichomonas foetus]